MVFKHIESVTKSAEGTQKAQPHGSMTTGGQVTIARPTINYSNGLGSAKNQAMANRYLVQQARPLRKSKHVRRVTGNEVEYLVAYDETPSACTAEELAQAADARLPASKEIIMLLLARLAMHKRMTVDVVNQSALFMDFADLLFGVPEYALALAVFEIIETDKGKWFPLVAEIKDAAESFIVKDQK